MRALPGFRSRLSSRRGCGRPSPRTSRASAHFWTAISPRGRGARPSRISKIRKFQSIPRKGEIMLDIVNNPPEPTTQEPEHGADRPELSRKGFIITYPMFRYWNKDSVEEGLKPKPLNLYVHTPYCIQRCAYCYFKTTTLKDNRLQEIDRYVSSVCKEIELVSRHYDLKNRPIETVYFGGGTPTLLTEENIDRLFTALRDNFAIGDAQITFEGEPVTLTERKAARLQRNGVKRISLGIQSFKEEVVFLTGRRDTEEQTFKAIELAKNTGAEVNIDL